MTTDNTPQSPLSPPAGLPHDVPAPRTSVLSTRFRVPFTVVDAGMVMLAYFIGQLVVAVTVGIGAGIAGVPLAETAWMVIAVVATLLGLVFSLVWLALRRRMTYHLRGPIGFKVRHLAFGVAFGIGGTIAALTLNGLLGFVFNVEDPVQQQLLQDALVGGFSLVLAFFVAVVLAPITEEVIFRGVLFQSLRQRIGLWPAAVVSSFVFTVIHVEIVTSQPLALVGLFGLGIVFAWAFHVTGNLVVPVIAHGVFNAISMSLFVLVDRWGLDEIDFDTLRSAVVG